MAKIKKRTPIPAGDSQSQRILNQIYKDINELIDTINYEFESLNEVDGKVGDLKITKATPDSGPALYFLGVKTEDGWIQIRGRLVEDVEKD